MKVRPEDAGDSNSLSIRVTLLLDDTYPESPPIVSVCEPRGLDDAAPDALLAALRQRMSEMQGEHVLYEAFQHCSEFLVHAESSSEVMCPICLCPLKDAQRMVTQCEHYLHQHCMDRYVEHVREELEENVSKTPLHMKNEIDRSLVCPVCRSVLEEDLNLNEKTEEGKKSRSERNMGCIQENFIGYEDFNFDWSSWQKELDKLKVIYERQLEKDGIIDLEKEAKKMLLTEYDVVIIDQDERNAAAVDEAPSTTSCGHHNFRGARHNGRDARHLTERRERGSHRRERRPREDAYNRGPPDESVSLGPPPGLEPVRRLLTESEAVQRAPKRGESAQRPFRSRIPSQRLSQREAPVLRPTEEGPTDQIPPREGESFNRHPGRVENSFRESQETQRPSRGTLNFRERRGRGVERKGSVPNPTEAVKKEEVESTQSAQATTRKFHNRSVQATTKETDSRSAQATTRSVNHTVRARADGHRRRRGGANIENRQSSEQVDLKL